MQSAPLTSEPITVDIDEDSLTPQALKQTSFSGIISQCSEMQKVFTVVEKVAKTNSTVLITGESGTGKELVARALHKLSGRSGKLVPVNCGAIPEDLLESELFGHEKGAFTGATQSRVGRFKLAEAGTIFLDEVAEMSPKLQVKLLRVLQEKCVEPVGSTQSLAVDVRVVAATNKDLRKEVEEGRFREDLYYRLQVLPIELPALRERGEDISLLANYFLDRSCQEMGKEKAELSDGVLSCFYSYKWSGNVRELENLVERLAILSDDTLITVEDLPDYMRAEESTHCHIIELPEEMPGNGLDFNYLVNEYETKLISLALEKTNWNKKAAAQLLQLNRTTLVEKIKKKGLEQKVEVIVEPDDRPFSAAV